MDRLDKCKGVETRNVRHVTRKGKYVTCTTVFMTMHSLLDERCRFQELLTLISLLNVYSNYSRGSYRDQ